MNQKQVLAAIDECDLSFRLDGNRIIVTSAFKPYDLMRVRINDFYGKNLMPFRPEKHRRAKYFRRYPTDIGEYADYLQERAQKSSQAIQERLEAKREARRESIRNVNETAREKWTKTQDDIDDENDAREAYEQRLEDLRKLLP